MDPLWNNYRPLFGPTPPNYFYYSPLQLLADDANSYYVVGVDIFWPTSDYRQLAAFREGLLRVQLPGEGNSYEKVKWQFLTFLSLSGDEDFNSKAATSEEDTIAIFIVIGCCQALWSCCHN